RVYEVRARTVRKDKTMNQAIYDRLVALEKNETMCAKVYKLCEEALVLQAQIIKLEEEREHLKSLNYYLKSSKEWFPTSSAKPKRKMLFSWKNLRPSSQIQSWAR
ncbi:unnamed protein product, partial [Ilex paraguariensis]